MLQHSSWRRLLVASVLISPVAAAAPAQAPKLDAADQRMTRLLDSVLRERISSPGGRLTLQITPSAQASQGQFSQVVIAARPAKIKRLRITELNMRARNVHIRTNILQNERKVRTIAANTSFRAVVTEDDLTHLLAEGKHSKNMGLRVKFLGGDRLRVTGNFAWGWISGPVTAVGRLRVVPGYKVHVQIESLKLRGAETPQFIKNKFEERVNPVLDYEDLPFRPQFKSLTVQGNRATLTA